MLRVLIVVVGVMMVVGAGVWAESSAVETNQVLMGASPKASQQEAVCRASVPKTQVSFKGLLDDPLCCTMVSDPGGRQVCLQQSVDRIEALHAFLWNIYSKYRSDSVVQSVERRSRGQACTQWSHRIDDKLSFEILTGKMADDPAEVNRMKMVAYLKSFPDYLSCLGYRDWSRDQGYID